tara:strand:+ start:2136 stop:2555 length:420 start_codon:yes stop_codon:yes gene_type:complete
MMRAAVTPEEAGRLALWVVGLTPPFTLTYRAGKIRTNDQNALIHRWFADIAKQTHSAIDQVKRECKFYQGCPILMAADPAFCAFLKHLKNLTLEEKIAAMDYVAVTSAMTTKQLSQMGDAMRAKYLPQGIHMTDPEGNR